MSRQDALRAVLELLPCPFCGQSERLAEEWKDGDGHPLLLIGCDTCGCPGESREHYLLEGVRERAVAAWNCRTGPALLSGGGDAWQPIETAPKDRAILVIGGTWHDDSSHTGNEYPLRDWALASWRNGWWIGYGETAGAECWATPTHWAPLPPAMPTTPEPTQ